VEPPFLPGTSTPRPESPPGDFFVAHITKDQMVIVQREGRKWGVLLKKKIGSSPDASTR
jgi:hypothetical protein